ncbi:MAG TPA: hypothetical protein DCD97_02220 [Firmicutes bacterium]|jgi:hypothetical protein|nr:DUF5320 domain-containing protein [Bacillota bacterium]HAA34107.1 hypothetical protein [Bacillota bacterium]
MPRGRYWYGPGFWKRGTGWFPGSGGFRGGAYYGHPGAFSPPWRGACRWFGAGYMPYPYWWGDEPEPEDEVSFLKEQAEAIRAELKEIEKRLAELGKEAQDE